MDCTCHKFPCSKDTVATAYKLPVKLCERSGMLRLCDVKYTSTVTKLMIFSPFCPFLLQSHVKVFDTGTERCMERLRLAVSPAAKITKHY